MMNFSIRLMTNFINLMTGYGVKKHSPSTEPFMTLARLLSLCLCIHGCVCSPAMGRLCGRELADTLDLVCIGRGFHWNDQGRSGVPEVSWRHRRHVTRRGIVADCCHNVCTVSTLEQYCARPASDSALRRLEDYMRAQFRPHGQMTPATPLTTISPTIVTNSTPSSKLTSGRRKFHSFFFLRGSRATRRIN